MEVLTKLNKDDELLLRDLKQENINITWKVSKHTTVFENIYDENVDKRDQKVLSIADPITIEDFPIKKYNAVHLGPLVYSDISIDVYQKLKKMYGDVIVSLDIQGHLRFVENGRIILKSIDIDFLKYIDILKLNEEEIYVLTKTPNYQDALRKLSKYVKEIVLTLGSKGSMVYYNGEIYEIPVFRPRKVTDVTGCGDVYMAAYLFMRLKGFHPQSAGLFASFVAGLKAEKVGVYIPVHINIE